MHAPAARKFGMKRLSESLSFCRSWLLFGVTVSAALAAQRGMYAYDQPGDKNQVNNTGVLERFTHRQQQPKLQNHCGQNSGQRHVTTSPIVVDGVREDAWDRATPYPTISNVCRRC